MGVYATVAVVLSLLYYMGARRKLQSIQDAGGPDMPLTKTNFHQEASQSRPGGGKYYTPDIKIFNN